MSDTPKLADECKKLTDNGRLVLLFRNAMGSYTARCVSGDEAEMIVEMTDGVDESCETDDFEPSQALYRLTEKVLTGRVV